MPSEGKIVVRGARVNNLKDITVEIPRNKFVVVTGISGSGKSSLAFDTLFAEGQRRFAESLSSYARQFLGQMEKPNVELIEVRLGRGLGGKRFPAAVTPQELKTWAEAYL